MNNLFSLSRSRDYDRYLCALFAPKALQAHLMALIAFNAEVATISEIVSDDSIGAIRLAWWRDALEEIYSGKATRKHEVVLALEETIHLHQLPKSLFDQIITARTADIEIKQGFDSQDAFIDYLKGSVGALHQLMAYCLNAQDAQKEQGRIENQAITYGIIGHLRAIPFHAEQGIIHWPKDILGVYGVNPAAVVNEEAVVRLRAFINHWLESLPTTPKESLPDTLKPLHKMHQSACIYAKKLHQRKANIAELPPRLASLPLRLWFA